MDNQSTNWKSVLFTSGSFLCEIAYKIFEINLFKYTRNRTDAAVNEILLYGAGDENSNKQTGLHNLWCINYILIHANYSIDICVPSITSETIIKCLITAQQIKKPRIRIAIYNGNNIHCLQLLLQNGIEVRVIKPTVKLEHEFMLIDTKKGFDDAVAVMGSLDYDSKQVNCNRDATILTSEVAVINGLQKEFDRVWNSVLKQKL